jgi:uncharacterized protein (DUF2344 family)
MKNLFILLSILIISIIAIFDNYKITANTPSQVEMKQMIEKPDKQMSKDFIQQKDTSKNFQEKSSNNTKQSQQKQLENVDRRRESIQY